MRGSRRRILLLIPKLGHEASSWVVLLEMVQALGSLNVAVYGITLNYVLWLHLSLLGYHRHLLHHGWIE